MGGADTGGGGDLGGADTGGGGEGTVATLYLNSCICPCEYCTLSFQVI